MDIFLDVVQLYRMPKRIKNEIDKLYGSFFDVKSEKTLHYLKVYNDCEGYYVEYGIKDKSFWKNFFSEKDIYIFKKKFKITKKEADKIWEETY